MYNKNTKPPKFFKPMFQRCCAMFKLRIRETPLGA